MNSAGTRASLSLERRTLLTLLPAGALVTACGLTSESEQNQPSAPGSATASPTPSSPETTLAAPQPPRRSLLKVEFERSAQFRPVHLVSPEFVQAQVAAVGVCSTQTRERGEIPAPFIAVELEVHDTNGGGLVNAGLLSRDGGEGIETTYDGSSGEVALVLTKKGQRTTIRRARIEVKRPFTLGFALCENRATALIRMEGGSWTPVLTERDRIFGAVDFRRLAHLRAMDYIWGVRRGKCHLGSVRAGLFGMTGLRDPHLVQNADGTPYLLDGRAFLTWTCAGLGFFQQAHWGVFSIDLDQPTEVRQVAQIYAQRDGLILGDHAGQLVRDGQRWLLVNSSWGDFDGSGVHVRHASTEADLLSGVHVVETAPTPLPSTLSTWDPSLTRIRGAWWMAYVESPSQRPFVFHPAIAQTASPNPFEDLSRVAAAVELGQTEGTILVRDSDQWRVIASDGDARRYRIFDLDLQQVGWLKAPYGSNIPHAQVIPHEGAWLMITFDGTDPFANFMGYGGHGDIIVLTERR